MRSTHTLVIPLLAWLAAPPQQGLEDVHRLLWTVAPGHEYDRSGDPEPARRLAAIFAEGRVVEPDPALACAFATRALFVTAMLPPRPGEDHFAYDARQKEAHAFSDRYCSVLSPTELKGAQQSIGCFAIGMPRDILRLEGASLLVDRTGIAMLDGPARAELPNCPMVVSSIRVVTAAAAPGAAAGQRPRHFIEVLYWIGGSKDGAVALVLHLYLLELIKDKLEVALGEPLLTSVSWPPTQLAVRSFYELHQDGRVRYELAGAITKHGWVEQVR